MKYRSLWPALIFSSNVCVTLTHYPKAWRSSVCLQIWPWHVGHGVLHLMTKKSMSLDWLMSFAYQKGRNLLLEDVLDFDLKLNPGAWTVRSRVTEWQPILQASGYLFSKYEWRPRYDLFEKQNLHIKFNTVYLSTGVTTTGLFVIATGELIALFLYKTKLNRHKNRESMQYVITILRKQVDFILISTYPRFSPSLIIANCTAIYPWYESVTCLHMTLCSSYSDECKKMNTNKRGCNVTRDDELKEWKVSGVKTLSAKD